MFTAKGMMGDKGQSNLISKCFKSRLECSLDKVRKQLGLERGKVGVRVGVHL
jgi:hypothetical protein